MPRLVSVVPLVLLIPHDLVFLLIPLDLVVPLVHTIPLDLIFLLVLVVPHEFFFAPLILLAALGFCSSSGSRNPPYSCVPTGPT